MLTTKAGPFHPELAEPIRCVIVDDHEMLRYGVRRLLEDAPDFTVVGEAGDAAEALKLVLEHRPDLVLLDISMPGMSSFEAGRLIEEHTGTRIVYLTMHEDREYVQQALRSGASGYLLKDTPAPLLLRALREVYRGERSLSPRIQTKVKDDASQPNQGRVPLRRSNLTLPWWPRPAMPPRRSSWSWSTAPTWCCSISACPVCRRLKPDASSKNTAPAPASSI